MSGGAILVVDDDASIRELLADFLGFEGYDVETASDGEAAWTVVERVSPALILVDLRMPGLDGREFAARLRASGRSTPLVIMTAASARDLSRVPTEADAVIWKPFDLIDLLQTVRRFVPHP